MDYRIKSVVFDEENHRYFYDGKELHGVTGAIGRLMGKNFPDTDIVKLATIYGSDVHKEVENYFNNSGKLSSEGAKWVVSEIERFINEQTVPVAKVECEVMVSDFEGTASKIDVVVHLASNEAFLFDIKTTRHFDRPYCSLQLSVYKDLFERNYVEKVQGMFVLGTKSRRLFRIFLQEDSKIQKILDMNKEANV